MLSKPQALFDGKALNNLITSSLVVSIMLKY
jgi:hypothetical protein